MKLLAIDSSGLVATVALLSDDSMIAEFTINYRKTHSQTLLPMIDDMVKTAGFDLKSLDAIATAAGPGSFTGLRIGSATAKGLAFSLNIPIIPVPTVDALAWNLCGSRGLVCPLMDARRSQVYTGLYRFEEDGSFTVCAPQRVVSIAELADLVNAAGGDAPATGGGAPATDGSTSAVNGGASVSGDCIPVTFLGDGVPPYRSQLDTLIHVPFRIAPPHLARQRAGAVGALGMKLYAEGKAQSAAEHVPYYLRMAQADEEKK